MLEVVNEEVEETIKLVKSAMEDVYSLEIPLTTEAQFGKDWGSLVEFTG